MTEPEELIDSVLRDYSDAEPSTGWERRILEQTSRPRVGKWFVLVPAFAAAAVAIIWVFRPVPPQSEPLQVAKVERHAAPDSTPVGLIHRSHVPQRNRPLPKQSVFPTPSPLTNEERVLLNMAANGTSGSDAFRPFDNTPIEITPIQINALEKEN